MTSQPKVCLGNINPGQLSVGFVNSLLTSRNHSHFEHIILHPNGPYLDMGRNNVVREFMKTDDDYLLFIDSDISWTAEDIDRLYANLSPDYVLGGYYLNPYLEGVKPVVYEWQRPDPGDPNGWLLLSITEDSLLARADSTGLALSTCIGTGFMCIPREILEVIGSKYQKPCEYFSTPIFNGAPGAGIQLGEDLAFCLRVWDAGYQVIIDTNIKLDHHKTVILK